MKKLFVILSLFVATIATNQEAEAANFSFSVGGFMPPVVVMDSYMGYYPYYSTPYYRNAFYFTTGGHHYRGHHRHMMRPPHHGGHGKPHHHSPHRRH